MAGTTPDLYVVHQLPGRVRLRYRSDIDAAALKAAAGGLAGVQSVRINQRARSLVLTYQVGATDAASLLREIAVAAVANGGSAPPRPAATTGAVVASLGAAVGVQVLPIGSRLPVSLAASVPIIRQGLADYVENGLTSRALEGLAVSISLARADYTAATTTAFLLTLGEHLENSVVRRADELLSGLLRPSATEVWVLRDDAEVEVPASEVAVGDSVIVGAGAVVPVDGTVLAGEATVNEAAMTGESVSAAKKRGDSVLSGTVVEEGRLVVYAEQVGAHTAAARIAEYVEQCLSAKSEAQLEASRLADRLVPVVLKVAGAAFLVSGDWRRAAAVLQADYACSLKLATPVAFKSAMYTAGQSGMLVKGARALERLASADTFVFDKTGTLTSGMLEVSDAVTFDANYTPDELVSLAASVEEHYFHPLAQAVVAAAHAASNQRFHHFHHQEVQFVVAHGVTSVIAGKRIIVGSRHFVEEHEGIDVSRHSQVIDRLYREGKTLLFIGFGGELLGVLALRDSVREASARTIRRLRKLGVRRILLLTGDHRDRARELAASLGIDAFHAELLPEDKAAIVDRLNRGGARIAFVGDGINDAPALAGAHVGIAMHRGADIARLTADIALLEDDIERVADAKQLANDAMRLIDRNYKATLWLNSAILGAAALGLLTPVATSVLHNGATIGILLNSLRRRFGGGKAAKRRRS